MKLIGQLAVSIIILALGTGVGIIVQQYRDEQSSQIRYLDREIFTNESIFSRPYILNKNLEISLDGKPIKNLSRVVVSVYNLSDRDFEQVPVYIDLEPSKGEKIEVVGEEALGANDLPEGISRLPNLKPSRIPGAVRYGYMIKTANRGEESVFRANYWILGDVTPKPSVETNKRGLMFRDHSYRHRYKESFTDRLFDIFEGIILFVIIPAGYIVFIYIIVRVQKKKLLKQDDTLKETLSNSFNEQEVKEELKLGKEFESSELAAFFITAMQKQRWEKVPRLLRFISAVPKPNVSEDKTSSN